MISTGTSDPDDNYLQIMSHNTMRDRIDRMYSNEIKILCGKLSKVPYVCATADVWSTKHKRFLGMTVHWIDTETLDRHS